MIIRILIKSVLAMMVIFVMSANSVIAAEKTKPIKMLFIGNSFTQQHNIPDQVRDFAERGNPGLNMETMRVIYGGSQAERHWNNYGTTNLLNLSDLKREDLEKQKKTMTEDADALRQVLDQGG